MSDEDGIVGAVDAGNTALAMRIAAAERQRDIFGHDAYAHYGSLTSIEKSRSPTRSRGEGSLDNKPS